MDILITIVALLICAAGIIWAIVSVSLAIFAVPDILKELVKIRKLLDK